MQRLCDGNPKCYIASALSCWKNCCSSCATRCHNVTMHSGAVLAVQLAVTLLQCILVAGLFTVHCKQFYVVFIPHPVLLLNLILNKSR